MKKDKTQNSPGKSGKRTRFATHLTTADGQRVYVSAPTREELDRKVQSQKMLMGAGVDIADTTTFSAFASLWREVYKSGLRPTSRETLNGVLDRHVLPYFGSLPLRDVRPLHVQAWLASLRPLSVSTQRKALQIARAIFDAAVQNGLILRSPVSPRDKAQTPDRPESSEPRALSDAQARSLLEAVKGTRAYLFCLLALSTGLRRGEALGLMWEDVDLDRKTITVRHNKAFPANKSDAPVTELLKSMGAHRVLPVPEPLLSVLREEKLRSGSSPYVLHMEDGRSLTRNSFNSLWSCVTNRTVSADRPLGSWVRGSRSGRLQVTLDFTCHPHLLRHTYITGLIEAGLDLPEVQYLAGHSSPDITMRVYAHYLSESRMPRTLDRATRACAYLAQENVVRIADARRDTQVR